MGNRFTIDFIIIDDDHINNILCQVVIGNLFPDLFIKTFTEPLEAIEYLQLHGEKSEANNTVIFLDINMPILSGWDVLDRFENFPATMKQRYKIFILSSSIAFEDKEKANQNPLICGFIEKPLSEPHLENIIQGLSL